MLCDHCPVLSCHVCLPVTSVHCGQTVEQIKIKFPTLLCLGPGHIVLDRDPAPAKGAQPPNFPPMSGVAKRLDGLRCHLVWM